MAGLFLSDYKGFYELSKVTTPFKQGTWLYGAKTIKKRVSLSANPLLGNENKKKTYDEINNKQGKDKMFFFKTCKICQGYF
jgi:hypothetical protein